MGALAVVLLLALASGGAQHARAQRGSDVSAASEQAASASSDQAASTGGTDSTADGIPADSAELEAARGRALGELGTDLGAADAETRTLAFDALRSLSVTRVDEVEARLRELRLTDEPPSAAAYNTLQDIRHHLGSQRADDSVDLARGARQLLGGARAPSRTLVQVAERMALLRGLEAMDSLAADRVMIGFFQRGWSVWQWEARHLVARRGLSMLAALIEARSAGNPEVRRWAVGSIRRLGVDSVGAAVQMASIEDLPDVLRAYASLSDLNAMPAVITFVDHPDPAVRAASREATASYERNAIWQLRLAHRNKLGENADLGWSWQITMQRLFDALDARRLAPANELLDEGLAAAESQSWADMHDRYERALRREPLLPRRSEMGPGYAGEALALLDGLEAGDEEGLRRALGLLRRAVRLAPEHPAAAEWRATVAFHEAERSRRAGVLDEGAYQEVLAVQPGHTAARAVLADIEEGGVGEVEASGVSLAARLLALVGVLLLLPYGLIAGGARRGWAALTPKLAQVRIAAVRYAAS
ncbi:MAG: hypothetical protein KC593_22430, partial [Myxococcales bacterium]|nr:hypothetical protein [Myxococcales bacterium]